MTLPGMGSDTARDNPVNSLPHNVFPIGAALTVAYGSNQRLFCTLGNLYRILGYLDGQVPGPYDIDAAIDKHRGHVLAALPTELRALDLPPADTDNEASDVAWLVGIANRYGQTIALPPTADTHPSQRS